MVSSKGLDDSRLTSELYFKDSRDWLERLVDTSFEGIIAVDELGTVVFANSFILKTVRQKFEEVVGQNVESILPGCGLSETIEQGYSQWGDILRINGKEFITCRLPLRKAGRVVGAMLKTVFPDMILARSLAEKLVGSAPVDNNKAYRAFSTCRDLVGESAALLYVKNLARKAARTNSTVLITGESGTGKGVLAQALHNRSPRHDGPFVSINCAAIPENLLEAELFGYSEGAFTGAKKGGKPGKFELAQGGTIFLDEIGDMPLTMQAKLLKVLQEKELERIGATTRTQLNVRVVTATNQKLKELVAQKKFREDLYYRLKVLEIQIPPLRERKEDIPMLVDALIRRINNRLGSDAKGVTPESMQLILAYEWPGNIRELENVLEQAIIWNDDPMLDLNEVPGQPWAGGQIKPNAVHKGNGDSDPFVDKTADEPPIKLHKVVDETEKELIIQALAQTNGNKVKAAQMLNIQRSVLYKKMKRLNI